MREIIKVITIVCFYRDTLPNCGRKSWWSQAALKKWTSSKDCILTNNTSVLIDFISIFLLCRFFTR